MAGQAGTSLEPSTMNTFEYLRWTKQQLAEYLKTQGFDEKVCEAFLEEELDGAQIPLISAVMLEKMAIKEIGVQNKILELFRMLQRQQNGKVFNDPIHGHFELHPLLVKVIDTPQFQRLRSIKQLGGVYYVFPGASHNRFEHSLGVCHIAGEFVEILQRNQPELDITEVDVLCVKMAGLCHDLGHGPFSHLFDQQFIPAACDDHTHEKWTHEKASVEMLEYLLDDNDLKPMFKKYGLEDQDIDFIKEMILTKEWKEEWPYKGRTEEKSFLYEIVANKRNGVDVDKWDYFARDCYHLGIRNTFDMVRYMKFARVISVDGRLQICIRDKDAGNLYEMFHTRYCLHKRAYQHKTKNAVEIMINDALLAANDQKLIWFHGKDCKRRSISDAINDMTAYIKLTDAVLHQIMVSEHQDLEKSRQLLLQVEKRKLYTCVGWTRPTTQAIDSEKEIQCRIVQLALSHDLKKEDFQVQVVTFNYGRKSDDPVKMMRFYAKQNPNKAFKIEREQVSHMLPQAEKFQEKIVRMYCKKPKKDEVALKCFSKWCEESGLILEQMEKDGESIISNEITPEKNGGDELSRVSGKTARKLF